MSCIVSRDTFKDSTTDDKLNILYDCTVETNRTVKALETKIEKKKTREGMVAAGMGLIGGFIAQITKSFWPGG